eukprot:1878161-Amphidinium_carterae.1
MVDLYARDTQAPALRRLGELLTSVRAGSFLPDETRSGRFVQVEPIAHEVQHVAAPAVADESQELLTSSDESSES